MGILINIVISIFANMVYRIIHVLVHNPNGKSKGNTTVVEGRGSAESLAGECVGLLKQKNKEHLLLKDFEFQNRLTDAEIRDLSLLQRKLQHMANELSAYLLLLPIPVYVMRATDGKDGPSIAGDYVSALKKIDFYVKDDFTAEQLKAILCHEYTHYFMGSTRMDDWSDPALNERRTDVMSNMIGFSNIMIEGYYVVTKADYQVFSWDVKSSRAIGYLNVTEQKIVRKELLKVRKEVNKERKRKERQAFSEETKERTVHTDNTESLRLNLKHRTEGVRQMLNQVNVMRQERKNPSPSQFSETEFRHLQEALLFLESGNDQRILRLCESADGSDIIQLQKAQDELMKLGNALYIIMRAYQ